MGNKHLAVRNNSHDTISFVVFKKVEAQGIWGARLVALAGGRIMNFGVFMVQIEDSYRAVLGKAGDRFETSKVSGELKLGNGNAVTMESYNGQLNFGRTEQLGADAFVVRTDGSLRGADDVAFGLAVGQDAAVVVTSPQANMNYNFKPEDGLFLAIGNVRKGEFINDNILRNAVKVNFNSGRMMATYNMDGTWSFNAG